jgi:hypothetical protein
MCTVLLPPGDNPIAVNKYINTHDIKNTEKEEFGADCTDGYENEEEKSAIL